MEFKELTIGSWMLYDGKPIRITGMTESHVYYDTDLHKLQADKFYLEPIEITEDILLGLHLSKVNQAEHEGRTVFIMDGHPVLKLEPLQERKDRKWKMTIEDEENDTFTCAYIDHVHQLQTEMINQGLCGSLNGIGRILSSPAPERKTTRVFTREDLKETVRLVKECEDGKKQLTIDSVALNSLDDGKTFYQLLRELKDWRPKDRHITSREEVKMLTNHFKLDLRNQTDLRNLRDTCVAYYTTLLEDASRRENAMLSMMSVTAVIDKYIYKLK